MKIIRSEKGFTLIEMITVTAILGAIMGVMSMTIGMIPKISEQSNDQAIALRQVQNAGYWISRDTQRAQHVHKDVTAPDFLIFTWTEWDYGGSSNIYHLVTYMLQDMPNGAKKFMRRHQDSEGVDEQILIAEYIYYDPAGDPVNSTKVIDYQSPILTVRITALFGEAEMVSRDYEASRRPTF